MANVNEFSPCFVLINIIIINTIVYFETAYYYSIQLHYLFDKYSLYGIGQKRESKLKLN